MTNTIESFEQNCQKALKQNIFYNKIYTSIFIFLYGLASILIFNNTANTVLSMISITTVLLGFVMIIVFYFLFKELTQQNVYFDEGKKQKQLNIIDFNNALKNSNVKKYKIYNKNSNKYIIMVETHDGFYYTDPKENIISKILKVA